MKPDVVIIHPETPKEIYQGLSEHISCIETPVVASNVAAFLQCRHWDVAFIDMAADHLTVEQAALNAVTLKPRFVVICVMAHQPSASTHNMTTAGEVARAIEAAGFPTLLMGGHPSALPERTLREEGCTYVAIGEGYITIDELLRQRDLKKIPGLAWIADGGYCENPPAHLMDALDRFVPMPTWGLLPMDKYRAYNWMCFGEATRQPYAALATSYGCPYKCHFCSVQSPFYAGQEGPANSYRLWSPAQVGKTLEHLVKVYGVRHVRLADEMFLLNLQHVEGICDEILKRKLDLNIYVYARADTCKDTRLLDKMRQAGVRWVCVGFESASEVVRDSVGKHYTNEVVKTAVKNLKAAGIHLLANFIVGLPSDTPETMEATKNQAFEMSAEFMNVYVAAAYPGSALYTQAVKDGWPLPSRWQDYSQHGKHFLALPNPALSSQEIVAFRDAMWREYFERPRYVDKIERLFGRGAVEAVQRMLAVRLERVA